MKRRTVVITGAGHGIGFHMCRTLLEGGYQVAAVDIDPEDLEFLRKKFVDLLDIYHCDVTDDEEVNITISSIAREWGQIDILVNNACLVLFAPFEDKSLDDTKKEFEVNFFGYVRMIKAVLPHFKARNAGIIHNVSSGVGITGFPGIYGYASTKGAIEALSRTLAIELKPWNIHVTLMHPPLTKTNSAAPLGIPTQAMADPSLIGQLLAKQIESVKPVITPNFQSAAGLFLNRHFPVKMGKFLAVMTDKARRKAETETPSITLNS